MDCYNGHLLEYALEMEIPKREWAKRGLAKLTLAQWKNACNEKWTVRKSQLAKHYIDRVKCDSFDEALMRVGNQYAEKDISNKQRRRLARQQ
eukprot:3637218-Alexandrium_andersonii.AAC.1